MHRKKVTVKTWLKRGLCALLSVAMILESEPQIVSAANADAWRKQSEEAAAEDVLVAEPEE
ncbi:MAG: hypothetical protein IJ747_09480, partial [Lachnospiraceae bacterium]|nr:hypothetical protein [Lachnospiraceae bacterium]MBR1772243.1 hypothetical protein [Lachnospiraceae bacterium]